jgi:Protein of unknown function (DUF3300)
MNRQTQKKLACLLACCAVVISGPGGFAYQTDPSAEMPMHAAQQTSNQLQQLVAPIALYPDALVAQILAAATYPDQIVEADRWVQQHTDLKGEQLGQAVDQESWDPSVKALAQFPAVLGNLDKNLSWTSSLGDAYVNQQQDVLNAVQVMRQRAESAGNLQTNDHEKVSKHGKTIVIDPVDRQVVYVPQYDPWLVYGAPIGPWPGWYGYPGLFWDGPGIGFGLGFGIGFFGGFGWGWGHWGADWHHGAVTFDHNRFVSRGRAFANRGALGGRERGSHAGRPGGFSDRGAVHSAPAFHGGGSRDGGAIHGDGGAFHGAGHMAPRSGAFGGFNHGGISRGFGARGRSSFGGGFHGGGFHGGGGRR